MIHVLFLHKFYIFYKLVPWFLDAWCIVTCLVSSSFFIASWCSCVIWWCKASCSLHGDLRDAPLELHSAPNGIPAQSMDGRQAILPKNQCTHQNDFETVTFKVKFLCNAAVTSCNQISISYKLCEVCVLQYVILWPDD